MAISVSLLQEFRSHLNAAGDVAPSENKCGKTEAIFFPLWIRIHREARKNVSPSLPHPGTVIKHGDFKMDFLADTLALKLQYNLPWNFTRYIKYAA
jgi:hypothetical protein